MASTDILDLDIRALNPCYLQPESEEEQQDLGIFHLDGEDLDVLVVPNGWTNLKTAMQSVFGQAWYSPPIIGSQNYWLLEDLLDDFKPEEEEYSEEGFRRTAEDFARHYFLQRIESNLETPGDYIRQNQNKPTQSKQPKISERAHHRERVTQLFYQDVRDHPNILGISEGALEAFEEVRLNNLASRFISFPSHYYKFMSRNPSLNMPLSVCDMVIEQGPELYILEVKVSDRTNNGEGKKPSRTRSDARYKAKKQLGKSALFFEHNFGVNPTILSAVIFEYQDEMKLTVDHLRFEKGVFDTVKQIEKTFPRYL